MITISIICFGGVAVLMIVRAWLKIKINNFEKEKINTEIKLINTKIEILENEFKIRFEAKNK